MITLLTWVDRQRQYLHSSLLGSLMPATDAQETCTRNLHVCRSILYNYFSCTSFFHAIEHSSCIPGQKLSDTWHEPCNVIGWPVVVVQETVMHLIASNFPCIFLCKFLAQFSSTSFLSVCRRYLFSLISSLAGNCALWKNYKIHIIIAIVMFNR